MSDDNSNLDSLYATVSFSEEEARNLEKKYKVKKGYDLYRSLTAAVGLYNYYLKEPKDRGRQKKAAENIEKRSRILLKSIDDYVDALKGFDKLEDDPFKRSSPALRRDVPDSLVEHLTNDVSINLKVANDVFNYLEDFEIQRGAVGNPALNKLLKFLIKPIYIEAISSKVTLAGDYDRGYTGSLFHFTLDCLILLGVDEKPKKIGKRLEKVIKEINDPAQQ